MLYYVILPCDKMVLWKFGQGRGLWLLSTLLCRFSLPISCACGAQIPAPFWWPSGRYLLHKPPNWKIRSSVGRRGIHGRVEQWQLVSPISWSVTVQVRPLQPFTQLNCPPVIFAQEPSGYGRLLCWVKIWSSRYVLSAERRSGSTESHCVIPAMVSFISRNENRATKVTTRSIVISSPIASIIRQNGKDCHGLYCGMLITVVLSAAVLQRKCIT